MTGGRRLALFWLAIVGALGVLLVVAEHTRSPLDDPDPARQRPGFLDATGRPTLAPPVLPGLPSEGRRAVFFFVSPAGAVSLCTSLAANDGLQRRADVAIVSSGPAAACPGVKVVLDRSGGLARAFEMPRPRNGASPVGYATVDTRRRIRYRTLDPTVAEHLAEVETIVRAEP